MGKEFFYPPIAPFLDHGLRNITMDELQGYIRVKISDRPDIERKITSLNKFTCRYFSR